MADIQRIRLDEIVRPFQELEDPRSPVNLQHPLDSVVVIAIMAVLAGAKRTNGDRQVGQYEGRVPLEDARLSQWHSPQGCLSARPDALKPAAFQACFTCG